MSLSKADESNVRNVQCKNVRNFLTIGEHFWPDMTKIKF